MNLRMNYDNSHFTIDIYHGPDQVLKVLCLNIYILLVWVVSFFTFELFESNYFLIF